MFLLYAALFIFSGVIINRETAGHRDDGGILFIDNLKNKVRIDKAWYSILIKHFHPKSVTRML